MYNRKKTNAYFKWIRLFNIATGISILQLIFSQPYAVRNGISGNNYFG